MNRTVALTFIMAGYTVEAIGFTYLRAMEHGGRIKFKWDFEWHRLQYSQSFDNGNTWSDWRPARNIFYLCTDFVLIDNPNYNFKEEQK